jgi:hypothetical protein
MTQAPASTSPSSPPTGSAAKAAAIVVTFHPDRDLLLRVIEAAAEQVSGLVVVDNGYRRRLSAWIAEAAPGAHPSDGPG